MDEDKFIAQINRYKNDLYIIALSILKNRDDAEDIVQEALLIAYEKIHTLKKEDKFKSWITKIVINQSKMHIRKNKKLIYVDKIEANKGIQPVVKKDDDIWEIVLSMKKELSVPTILFYSQGYRIREISNLLRIPAGTVKSRLAKARQLLKKMLED